MIQKISLTPIGHVVCPVTETVDEKWGEILSKIVLLPEYTGGLCGISDFSHAIIITYLDRAKYEPAKHLKRRPRGLDSMPLIGIFSQRAKDRPNQIGITAVKIIGSGIDFLEVRGLDAVNGTPVLDIKPYFPAYDRVENPKTPEWVDRLMTNYF